MKKLSIFIVSVLMCFSVSALAEDVQVTTLTSPEEKQFTLDTAIEFAEKNHASIIAQQANVTANEYKRDEAKSAYNEMDDKNAFSFEQFMLKKGLVLKSSEAKLTIAQKGLELANAGIKNGVTNAFLRYLGMAEKYRAAKDTYNLAVKKQEDMQKKKDAGLVSDFDMLTFKVMVKQAEINVNKIARDVDTAEFSLKISMGMPSSSKISVSGVLEIPKIPEITLVDAIAKAKENRMEVFVASQNYLLSKESFRITGLWFEEKTYKYQQALYLNDVQYYQQLTWLDNVEQSVRDNYNNMKTAYDALDMLDSSIELAKAHYELTQKKYELGLATGLDVSDTFQNLGDLNINKADAIVNCIMAEKNFELSYSLGFSYANAVAVNFMY